MNPTQARVLILAAGRFDEPLANRIRAGEEPKLDIFELQVALRAEVLDFRAVDGSRRPAVRLAQRLLGDSVALALIGAEERARYDAVLTTGEDIGIPLAALWKGRRAPVHTMIAHTLTPAKKRLFFQLLRVQDRIDRILCYSSNEERHMVERLGIPASRVQRIRYHADDHFFRPTGAPPEPDLICSAGQLLRDYPSLIEAVRDLPVRLRIAAGSPWIAGDLRPDRPLPGNVEWRRYPRAELRELYSRAALAVVPIFENNYQTGISTILEMMAMGKCVIASRTRGQTDTIIDGKNGVYVPPEDPSALRSTIQRLLRAPEEAARIGAEARRFIEREASTARFVERVAAAVRAPRG